MLAVIFEKILTNCIILGMVVMALSLIGFSMEVATYGGGNYDKYNNK